MPMASLCSTPLIQATSQQSHFHVDTLDASTEIDLKGVTLSVGERELISLSHLKLKEGVRYGFIGRNGSGKSTLLTAIADKLIPGIGPSLRILLLSQVEDTTRAATEEDADNKLNVLEHTVRGDNERFVALEKFRVLTHVVESSSLVETARAVRRFQLEQRQEELREADKISRRRSGARGKEARIELLRAEKRVKDAEAALEEAGISDIPADIMTQAVDVLADVQVTLDLLESNTTEARARSILSGLGFSQDMMKSPYSSLSGGWKSRCSLAVSLLVQSDMLLLDEPTNFLDLEATLWLEEYLRSQSRTIVLVSHDQDFLDNVVEETVILRKNTLRYFEGTPTASAVEERKTRKKLLKAQDKLDTKKEHIQESNQKGMAKTGDENRQRTVKSRQRKLDDRWGVETSVNGTRFKLNRDRAGWHESSRAALVIEDLDPTIKIVVSDAPKLRTIGDLIHFEGVAFQFPRAKAPLLEHVTFTVEQGGRCAFIGANGNGKSTIAKLNMGQLSPTKGVIARHPLMKVGYFSQHSVEELSISKSSLASALSYVVNHFAAQGEKVAEQEARACLGSFGLQGKAASETPISVLSGGQKVRLALALLVFRSPSLLLLDEVTTHVDAPTIQALGRALQKFSGAIILITHDRWFGRVVVEGAPPRAASADDNDSDDSDDELDEDTVATGKTYLVGNGKTRLLEKGMAQYVRIVKRKLERKGKDEELGLVGR